MAEIGIIASVIQIADTGLRLSIKLYTFGEIVSTADQSVISISKDVSLTSSVLKELGSLLENDAESHIFSKNAVQTADTVVKECLEVFQEMESILVKKLPSLSGQEGIRGAVGGKKSKATALLERMKWGYLQPKLQLLRSNLDRLKSTLLLMLNVITYARQVAGKSEPPSVIEDQRSLIEDLARSNQDYIRKFEQLKLGVLDTQRKQEENVQGDRTGDGIELEREHNTQNRGHSKSTNPERPVTANVNINNMYINANVQSISIPQECEKAKQPREAQVAGSERDNLFSHLKHYLRLVNNLLNEVDEIKYEIRIDSRDRVRTDICQAYQREMKQLDTSHKNTKNILAEEPLAPLVAGVKRRLEQMEGPETEGRGRKRMSPNIINNGPQHISQPQPDPDDMQFCEERADESNSMPSNNDLSNPDLLENFDFEDFLQSTDGGQSSPDHSAFEPDRSPKLPGVGAVESHAIQDQQRQSMLRHQLGIKEKLYDSIISLPVGRMITPKQQHESLEASQQRLNPAQQVQRDPSIPIQHHQGQIHLNQVISGDGIGPYDSQSASWGDRLNEAKFCGVIGEIVAARSEFPAQRIPNGFPPASAPYLGQPSARKASLSCNMPLPPPRNRFTQPMTFPNHHQVQAQQHQQLAVTQQQQLKRLPPNQQVQQLQQQAYINDCDQMYQARGNGQAQRSLLQAHSVQGELHSSLSGHQSATPIHPMTGEPPDENRGHPGIMGYKRRVREVPAPIPSKQSSRNSESYPQARPLQGPLRGSVHEIDYFSGSIIGSGEQGTAPVYDDLMQKVEAAVMGISPPSSSASHQRSARSRKHEPIETRSEGQCSNYDMYNNSGDTEAEAGSSAMQMAVEQDGKYSGGGDINANMTTYAGGSPDHAHYGNRLPPLSLEGYGYSNEVDEVGGPFITAPSSSRPPLPSGAVDVHDGLYDYQVPEPGSVKPYASARVDVTGTGGLVEAGVQPRRLSFGRNEEEATMIESPPIDSDTNADQARRLKLQQEQEDPRTVSVHGTDLQGNLLSNSSAISPNTPRKPFQEKERSVNPMSGYKVNKTGEIRGEDHELLGMLTDGHLPDLVGLEVDNNGYVLDTEGNRVGECTLIQNVKRDEGPAEEETMAAHDAGFTKKTNLNDTKHKHARRRPRGPGGRFLTAVEAWLNKKGQRKQEQVLQSFVDSRPQSPLIQGRGPDVDIMPTEQNDPPVIPRQSLIIPLPSSPEGGRLQRYAADTAGSQMSEPETSREGRRSITAGVALKRRDKPLPDINVEDSTDTVPVKRWRNTLAARKWREKRKERAEAVVNQNNELKEEVEHWKMIGKPNSVGLVDNDDVPVAKKRKMAPKKTLGGESEKSEDNDEGISDAGHSVYHGRDSTKTMPPGFGSSTDGSHQLPKREEFTPIDRGAQLVLPTIEGDRETVMFSVSCGPPRLERESNGMRPPERRESRSLQRRLRSSTSPLPDRDYILGTADPSRSLASEPDKRVQKSPATLQCTLCPKKFNRAYLLRSHLRAHYDECAASAADRDRSQKDQSGSLDALMDNGPQPRDQHECEAGINSNSGQILVSHVASQNIPRPPKDETYVAGRQQRTSELSTINGKVLNEDSKHSELSGDEGAKLAVDDMDIELELDAGTVTADVSGAHPGDHASRWPLNLREEEDALDQRTVPGTVGSVVDELVALWTMLPVG